MILFDIDNNPLQKTEQIYLTTDETLSSTTTSGQSGPGSNGNEQYSTFPKAQGLERHYQMQFSIISRIFIGSGESYPSAEMYSTWASHIRTLVGEACPSAEMQSVYSTALADWASHIRTLVGESYPSAEMQSVYSTVLADWAKMFVCVCFKFFGCRLLLIIFVYQICFQFYHRF